MLIFLWLCFINAFHGTRAGKHYSVTDPLWGSYLRSAQIIYYTAGDVVKDSNQRITELYIIKQDNMISPAFEVGYLMQTIEEKYRKMVDKYNISHFLNTSLYIMELVMYLEEIEHHYFELVHLNNMAHEIERKYKITTDLHEVYVSGKKVEETTPKVVQTKSRTFRSKRHKLPRYMQIRLEQQTKARYRGRFQWDYGWEVEGLP